MKTIKLERWEIVVDPYQAPEVTVPRLRGYSSGDPRRDDGHLVTTSGIVKIDYDKKEIITYSGSVYSLGTVNEDYRVWAVDNCPEYKRLWE